MSLIAELKRRNVLRAAGLYLVGSWLTVQVASTVLPTFGVTGWVLRGLIIALAIGFLPAMIVAWVFELTPEGIKRDEDVKPEESIGPQTAKRMDQWLLVVSLVAIGYFAFDKFVLAPQREATLVTQTTAHVTAAISAAKAKTDPRSIAVLPFLNMSDDKDNLYFADGISEELLNVLVKVKGFSVASRTSSFAYQGKDVSTAQIAKELGVRYVLEGSVRKQGDEVRITAQLIDASDDRHVFSQTYDRQLADIFKVQDEIANAIVDTVRTSVGDATPGKAVNVRADTDNLDAYQAYLKARELFLPRSDLKESAALYEHAVELDPKFARGWEGLSAVYSIMPGWGFDDRDYTALAEKAAHRAIDLDPNRSMAWAALGNAGMNRLPVDWATSIQTLDRAIQIDPHNSCAMLWRASAWLNLGFFQKGIADLDLCVAVDPHYGICSMWKALALVLEGETDKGLALYDRGLAAGYTPNQDEIFATLAVPHRDHLQWYLLMEAYGTKPALATILASAISQPELPHPKFADLQATYFPDPHDPFMSNVNRQAMLCLLLREFDCIASNPALNNTVILHWLPQVPGLRNSPGFKHTLERLGVPDYWRKHGYPPECHAVGDKDFSCDLPTPAVSLP